MSGAASSSRTIRPDDAGFASTLEAWLNDDASDVDECDEEFCMEICDNDSESDISGSEGEEDPMEGDDVPRNSHYGKNRYKWSSEPFISRSRTPKHNIVLHLPGVKGPARVVGYEADPENTWNFLFTEQMLQDIISCTNMKLRTERQKYKDPNSTDMRDLDMIELRALLGLLLYSAVFKSNHENSKAMFATDGTGRDIFRCVMSEHRFNILLSMLHFDNATTREESRKEDAAAPISEMFAQFVNNCQSVYTIGTAACVDEMLIGFRGRCKFKVYMPKKPAKYGIKLMALADARNGYFLNGYIYSGKDTDGATLPQEEKKYSKPTQSVIRLSTPIQGTNRNVTADNWFSSIEVMDVMKEKGLTYVGTLRKNKREIPNEFLPKKSREANSCLFGFTKFYSMTSYVPKMNKAVIVISSMHHDKSIDDNTKKPEMIEYYNLTKGGVDSLDEKCANYCSDRRSRRWSMALFYRLLDISTVNAYILYNSYRDSPQTNRLQFMKNLASMLVRPHIERRMNNPKINREVRLCIRRVLGVTEDTSAYTAEEKLEKRKTCTLCDPRKKRKTSYMCHLCKNPVCLECTKKVCKQCAEEEM